MPLFLYTEGRRGYLQIPFITQVDHVDEVSFFLVCMLDFREKDCIRGYFQGRMSLNSTFMLGCLFSPPIKLLSVFCTGDI